MKIKRIIAALAVISMLHVSALAAGNSAVVTSINFDNTDFAKSTVTISGTLASGAAEQMTVMVVKDGINLDLPGVTTDNVRYFNRTARSNPDGSFEFTFPIEVKNSFAGYGDSGEYRYTISTISTAAAGNSITGTFYGASVEKKNEVLGYIDATASDILAANLDSYARILGIDNNKAYINANKANVVAKITPADFVTSRGFLKNVNVVDELNAAEAKILEAAILDCYNNGKTAGVAEGTDFLNADIIGLTALPNGSELYDFYDSSLNVGTAQAPVYIGLKATGKSNVIAAMQGKNLNSYAELNREFMKATILNGIKNVNVGGAGHISYILTSANTAAIGDADLDAAMAKYIANSAVRDSVNRKIYDAAPATIAALASAVSAAVDAALSEAPTNGGTGGGVGNGGSGNGNGSGFSGPAASSGAEDGNGGTAEKGIFTDVQTNHWAYDDIFALYNLNVIGGYPDGSFNPDGNIKRQEALKMICEGFGLYGTGIEISFADVPVGAWYENYVKIGVENGITKGTGGNLFGTDESISRQDLAVMLYRMAGSPAVEARTEFSDAESIAYYAANALNYMAAHGIISGYPDGTIRPTKAITRAEAAKIINGCIKEGF